MTADQIKAIRVRLRRTQKGMAAALGVAVRTYIRYEQGGPIPKSVIYLAERLDGDNDLRNATINAAAQVWMQSDPNESAMERMGRKQGITALVTRLGLYTDFAEQIGGMGQ